MPTACNTRDDDVDKSKSSNPNDNNNSNPISQDDQNVLHSNHANGDVTRNGDHQEEINKMQHGFIDDDVDDEMPTRDQSTSSPSSAPNETTNIKSSDNENSNLTEESLVLIPENTFTIKLSVPGIEPFELQVNSS